MKKVTQLCALALCFFLAGNYQGHAQSKDQTFAAFIAEGGGFALPVASYALRF
jgi:hypothetical protein